MAPQRLAGLASGSRPDWLAVAVTRALGVRHLAQVTACLAFPVRMAWLGGAAVDGLHALSMLGLAVVDRRCRVPALTDAAVAAGWGVASALVGLTLPGPQLTARRRNAGSLPTVTCLGACGAPALPISRSVGSAASENGSGSQRLTTR